MAKPLHRIASFSKDLAILDSSITYTKTASIFRVEFLQPLFIFVNMG